MCVKSCELGKESVERGSVADTRLPRETGTEFIGR
jgi:hypothetical protein